jgi:hypothetical protein
MVGRFYDVKKLQAHPSMLCGDSTPSYLLHGPLVIPRLQATMPWLPPLIVCLRDPVARAYSHYQVLGRRHTTDCSTCVCDDKWPINRLDNESMLYAG